MSLLRIWIGITCSSFAAIGSAREVGKGCVENPTCLSIIDGDLTSSASELVNNLSSQPKAAITANQGEDWWNIDIDYEFEVSSTPQQLFSYARPLYVESDGSALFALKFYQNGGWIGRLEKIDQNGAILSSLDYDTTKIGFLMKVVRVEDGGYVGLFGKGIAGTEYALAKVSLTSAPRVIMSLGTERTTLSLSHRNLPLLTSLDSQDNRFRLYEIVGDSRQMIATIASGQAAVTLLGSHNDYLTVVGDWAGHSPARTCKFSIYHVNSGGQAELADEDTCRTQMQRGGAFGIGSFAKDGDVTVQAMSYQIDNKLYNRLVKISDVGKFMHVEESSVDDVGFSYSGLTQVQNRLIGWGNTNDGAATLIDVATNKHHTIMADNSPALWDIISDQRDGLFFGGTKGDMTREVLVWFGRLKSASN